MDALDGSVSSVPRLRLLPALGIRSGMQAGSTPATLPALSPAVGSMGPDARSEGTSDHTATPRIDHEPLTGLMLPIATSAFAYPDTPAGQAAQLRALVRQSTSTRPEPAAPSVSDFSESDVDVPGVSNYSSIARLSLAQLIGSATRDLGGTPPNGKQRRNSVDMSDMESSPRRQFVRKIREDAKERRKSLSDDDTEARSGSHQTPVAASAFQALTARLTASVSNTGRPIPQSSSERPLQEDPSFNVSNFASSTTSSPAATSTPIRSSQFPPFDSNLLDHDSRMREELLSADLYSSGNTTRSRTFSNPTSRPSTSHLPAPKRPLSMLAQSHSTPRLSDHKSATNLHQRDGKTLETRPLSRASSVTSRHEYSEHDRLHEREREWNKPHPKARSDSHEGQHRHHHERTVSQDSDSNVGSPVRGTHRSLSRKSSVVSLLSADDSMANAGSGSSQADLWDRIEEQEAEKNHELERRWNKPILKSKASTSHVGQHDHRSQPRSGANSPRSSSSLSVHSTHANNGHPTADQIQELEHGWNRHHVPPRPSSSMEHHAHDSHTERPDSPALPRSRTHSTHLTATHRHHDPSSRPTSPGHAIKPAKEGGEDEAEEEEHQHEVEHVRERNWNSPRPDWHVTAHRHPHYPVHEPVSDGHNHSQSQSLATPSIHRSRSRSPGPATNARPHVPDLSHPPHQQSRPLSPLPLASSRLTTAAPSYGPGASVAGPFKWTLPSSASPHHGPKEVLDNDVSTASRSIGRASPTSHLPVLSSPKRPTLSNAGSMRSKGHKRNSTELSASVGSLGRFSMENVSSLLDKAETGPQEATDVNPIIILSVIDSQSEESPDEAGTPPAGRDTPLPLPKLRDELGQRDMIPAERSSSTPPPAPPNPLSTPIRRTSITAAKPEYKTPPPPEGLPPLPGPPSEEEDGLPESPTKPTTGQHTLDDLSLMKTPRFPGGWVKTPEHESRSRAEISRPRSHSTGEVAAPSQPPVVSKIPKTPLRRTSTLPAETPIVPGRWIDTPYTARKQVRFDIHNASSQISESMNGDVSVATTSGTEMKRESAHTHNEERAEDSTAPPSSDTSDLESIQAPSTIYRASVAAANGGAPKPMGIRMMDPYGREHMSEEETVKFTQPNVDSLESSGVNESTAKTCVRLVDAMGREMEQVAAAEEDKASTPTADDDGEVFIGREARIAAIKGRLAELSASMNDADVPPDHPAPDQHHLSEELDRISQKSRSVREQLSRTLEEFRKQGYRSHHRFSVAKPSRSAGSAWDHPRFWVMLACFFFFALWLYRRMLSYAEHLFLTTYYDPFYPDLHIHVHRPNLREHYMGYSTPTFSIFAIPDTVRRVGWVGVLGEIWGNATHIVDDWQRDALHALRPDPTPIPWPLT